jgi:hypothetical protein
MTKARPADLIHPEPSLIESGLQLQVQGLELLLAEMRALTGMLAATAALQEPTPQAEAETEAGYDNMPV